MTFLVALCAPAAAPAKLPSGSEILQRCQNAYDGVKTLEDDVTATMQGASFGGKPAKMGGTAHILFQRPGKLSVTGKSLFGSSYILLSDGTGTWVKGPTGLKKLDSVELGIASITGISGNAGTAVPATLFHTGWGALTKTPEPIQVSVTALGGRKAYLLNATSPMKVSIWIDAQTYFLAKTSMNVMGQQTIVVEFQPPKVNRPIPASAFKRP